MNIGAVTERFSKSQKRTISTLKELRDRDVKAYFAKNLTLSGHKKHVYTLKYLLWNINGLVLLQMYDNNDFLNSKIVMMYYFNVKNGD